MGPLFLSGRLVNLHVRDKESNFDASWRWVNDPNVRVFLAAYNPVTRMQEEEWFSRDDPGAINFAIVTRADPAIYIGNIGLHHIDHRNCVAETGTLIGEPEYWGRGYGTDAKMILLKFAFGELNLRKIVSHIFAFNERSIAYAKKCGYEVEAVHKEEKFRDGEYVDIVRMAVFRPQFERAWEDYQRKAIQI